MTLIESTGGDATSIYNDVGHDILLLNSAGEPDEARAGGLMNQILGDKFQDRIISQTSGSPRTKCKREPDTDRARTGRWLS